MLTINTYFKIQYVSISLSFNHIWCDFMNLILVLLEMFVTIERKKNVQRNFRKQILLTKLNWCVVFFICIHCNAAHCQHSIFDFFFPSFFIFFALQCWDLKGLASERKKREKKTFKLNFCVTSFEKNFFFVSLSMVVCAFMRVYWKIPFRIQFSNT